MVNVFVPVKVKHDDIARSVLCFRDRRHAAPSRRCRRAPLEKLVTVTGEATVAVAPDTAVIRIGVTSQGKTAREASDANAKQMTAVLAAIKDSGIADARHPDLAAVAAAAIRSTRPAPRACSASR